MAEPSGDLRAGQLLVATPALLDPNFMHSVVLLLNLDEDGALGVVLNRPSPVRVADVLADFSALAGPPGVVFQGGPVATDSALAVAEIAGAADQGEDPVGWRRLFGSVGLVDLDTPSELLADAVTRMRVFAGYAGWGADQLTREVDEGSWYVVPSHSVDLTSPDPGGLWTRVLRRQPGRLAWASTRPADPTQN